MARFYVSCPDGTRKRVHICKRTRAEAVRQMHEEQRLSSLGTPALHDGRTVSEWLDYWLENVAKNKVKPSTWIQYEQAIRLYIRPMLGRHQLDKLAPHHVQEMIDARIKCGSSPRRCQIVRNVLSAALTCAVKREILPRNVSRLVDIPQDIRKEREVWTKEQLETFLDAAKDHQYFPAFQLLCTYGMRRGEVLGLRWCDINIEAKTIDIKQQLIQCGKHIFIGTTKTNAGKRTLPLMPHIEALLADIPRKGDNDSLIFQSCNGTPVQPNNLYRLFRQFSKKAGLPQIALHDIRHSVATLMKEADVPIKDAQMMLGHADPSTTMRIYQHSSLDSKRNALERMATLGA